MRSVFVSLATAALLATTALGQFTINTPIAVQCEPVQLSWSGGTPPYFLSILPGNQPTAQPLVDLGTQTGSTYTWLVNIAAGTSLGLNLRDSMGQLAQSAPFTVQTSSITACIGQQPSTASGGATSGAPGTSPPVTPPTTPPATTAPRPTTTAPPAVSATSHASSAPSASSTRSGASRMSDVGFAGMVGAAILALFA